MGLEKKKKGAVPGAGRSDRFCEKGTGSDWALTGVGRCRSPTLRFLEPALLLACFTLRPCWSKRADQG